MINTPDYETAAIKAMELLRDSEISRTPIDALSLLLKYPGVRVMSFANMAASAGEKREQLVPLFGANQDAATFNLDASINDVKYVVVYNMYLTMDVVMRGIARELGHIVLNHDGMTRTPEARLAEAKCFAHHLTSPRPILHMLQQSGMPLTATVLADTTSCSLECAEDMQRIPGVHVPKELNRQVKERFAAGINDYIRFHRASQNTDNSQLIDLGHFMDFYEE